MGAHNSVIGVDEPEGSLDAVYQFFDGLPPDPSATFVLVLPHGLEDPCALSEQLARRIDLPVATVSAPTSIMANRVYLSPPGRQLVLHRDVLEPVAGEEPVAQPVPMVYMLRSLGVPTNGGEPVEVDSSSYRLMLQAASTTTGSAQLPVTVIDQVQQGPSFVKTDAPQESQSRIERLESELRETRAELQDMVQKHETAQRQLEKTNDELQSANEALEQHAEQVQSLSESLTLAEERERKRLSHVLHDDLQQVLFAVRTKLDLLESALSPEGREEKLLTRAIEMLDDGIDTTRTLVSDLNPPVESSLWDTLDWLSIQMQEAHGLSVEMQAQGLDRSTGKELRVLVVRLVQELLFNVVKHAGTDEARLCVVEGDDLLRVSVEDDGTGFHPEEAIDGAGDGFGLGSVRERVELVGGRISVESAPGTGTQVVLALPYHLEERSGDEAVSARET